jgi:Family of unknown function (DUF6496)
MAARKRSRKSSSRKSSRKTSSRKSSSRKSTRRKGGRKSTRRKGGRRKSRRKYGPKAGQKVERSMREMKRGKLRSGRSGKKVTSRKQAIAIGLSEARRAGGKVPRKRSRRKSR